MNELGTTNDKTRTRGIVKSFQKIVRSIEDVRINLLPTESSRDDAIRIELRRFQRNLIGDLTVVVRELGNYISAEQWDPFQVRSELTMLAGRCAMLLKHPLIMEEKELRGPAETDRLGSTQ